MNSYHHEKQSKYKNLQNKKSQTKYQEKIKLDSFQCNERTFL